MNKDIVEGKYKQLRGKIKQQWGKLTDDELDRIEGNADELAGIVQERYGKGRDEAQREVSDFMKRNGRA